MRGRPFAERLRPSGEEIVTSAVTTSLRCRLKVRIAGIGYRLSGPLQVPTSSASDGRGCPFGILGTTGVRGFTSEGPCRTASAQRATWLARLGVTDTRVAAPPSLLP